MGGPVSFGRRRAVAHRFAVALTVLSILALAAPPQASAYVTHGCKWSTGSLRIDWRWVIDNYRTGLSWAAANYTSATDVALTPVNVSGPAWTAVMGSYGATGWEGQASWSCPFSTTHNAQMRLSTFSLPGSTTPARLKITWAHEIGHVLGLSHVSRTDRVMYTAPGTAYVAGVRALTSDEINGINSLY